MGAVLAHLEERLIRIRLGDQRVQIHAELEAAELERAELEAELTRKHLAELAAKNRAAEDEARSAIIFSELRL
eukprot:SAG31_NODE_272_length_18690_cov_14.520785_21_plen_73_part_00